MNLDFLERLGSGDLQSKSEEKITQSSRSSEHRAHREIGAPMETHFMEAAYFAKAVAIPPHSKWVRVGAIRVGL